MHLSPESEVIHSAPDEWSKNVEVVGQALESRLEEKMKAVQRMLNTEADPNETLDSLTPTAGQTDRQRASTATALEEDRPRSTRRIRIGASKRSAAHSRGAWILMEDEPAAELNSVLEEEPQ